MKHYSARPDYESKNPNDFVILLDDQPVATVRGLNGADTVRLASRIVSGLNQMDSLAHRMKEWRKRNPDKAREMGRRSNSRRSAIVKMARAAGLVPPEGGQS